MDFVENVRRAEEYVKQSGEEKPSSKAYSERAKETQVHIERIRKMRTEPQRELSED
jgi:hypothetical protein